MTKFNGSPWSKIDYEKINHKKFIILPTNGAKLLHPDFDLKNGCCFIEDYKGVAYYHDKYVPKDFVITSGGTYRVEFSKMRKRENKE